jgi:hypothetical protein
MHGPFGSHLLHIRKVGGRAGQGGEVQLTCSKLPGHIDRGCKCHHTVLRFRGLGGALELLPLGRRRRVWWGLRNACLVFFFYYPNEVTFEAWMWYRMD